MLRLGCYNHILGVSHLTIKIDGDKYGTGCVLPGVSWVVLDGKHEDMEVHKSRRHVVVGAFGHGPLQLLWQERESLTSS